MFKVSIYVGDFEQVNVIVAGFISFLKTCKFI